jgi:hypothetical protein
VHPMSDVRDVLALALEPATAVTEVGTGSATVTAA